MSGENIVKVEPLENSRPPSVAVSKSITGARAETPATFEVKVTHHTNL